MKFSVFSMAVMSAFAAAARADLPSGLPDSVAVLSPDAPKWAAGAFENMSEPPFCAYFAANPEIGKIEKEKFFPFVDKFGQFMHARWPSKTGSDADLKRALEAERKYLRAHTRLLGLDKYGGVLCGENFGKGRFRLQKINGAWFFITPEGNPFWSFGINAVGRSNGTRITGREKYFAPNAVADARYIERYAHDKTKSDFFNFEARNKAAKYASADEYLQMVKARFAAWGANTMGNWSDPALFARAGVPFCATVDCASARPIGGGKVYRPDYFDPEFEKKQNAIALAHKSELDSPYCLGAFIGYKMRWQYEGAEDICARVLASPADQPAKKHFAQMLRQKYGDIKKLNAAWGAGYADFEDFLKRRDFSPAAARAAADFCAFKSAYFERFFAVCGAALKKASAGALYLGSRFHKPPKPEVARAAAKYCDALSYVWYFDDAKTLRLPEGAADKPIIVAEFNFGALDRGVFGGGVNPRANAAKQAAAFENFALGALANPQIAGMHWMRWSDCPTSAKHNGENTACGFVDICDTPSYPLAEAARKISKRVFYRLSSNKNK